MWSGRVPGNEVLDAIASRGAFQKERAIMATKKKTSKRMDRLAEIKASLQSRRKVPTSGDIKARRKSLSEPRATTGTSRIGRLIQKVGASSIKEASADDPIYTRGFIIGGRYSSRRPRSDDQGD